MRRGWPLVLLLAGSLGTPAHAAATSGPDTVTLITGGRVSPSGAFVPARSGGPGRALVGLRLGGKAYEVPVMALPYLGRELDPALFEPALLRPTAGRTSVRLTYRGPAPKVPGVTLDRTYPGGAEGHLTPASARTFGAALARQFVADHRRGEYGGHGLFAGDLRISAPGTPSAPPAPAVRPMYQMSTLTVRGIDAAGHADDGDSVFAVNTDDSDRFGDQEESQQRFGDGEVRYSVPNGHYALVAYFVQVSAAGEITGLRIVSRPDITVTANRTVTLDARTARGPVRMRTPRPATPRETGFVYQRVPRHGPDLYLDVSLPAGASIATAATPAVTTGRLHTYPYQRLTGPGDAYEYFLQVPSSKRIPASQTYRIRRRDVAEIDAAYYSDTPSHGEFFRLGLFPFERGDFVLRPGFPLSLPLRRREYVSAGPSLIWYDGFGKYLADGFPAGGQYAQPATYRAGRRVHVDWNRYPLHPSGPASTMKAADPNASMFQPPVTRQGDKVALWMIPFTDDQPGHEGTTFTGTYSLTSDGARIAGGDADTDYGRFYTRVTVAPEPATLRLTLDASRTGPQFTLSNATHTEWTWRSARHPDARLPYGWTCYQGSVNEETPPPTHDCDVEPLLTLRYAVAGLRLDGSAAPGAQRLRLTAGHLLGSSAPPVSAATVQVSQDDGKTWRPARVTGRHGHFTAIFPATAGFVSLRVHARDGAGGAIDETVLRAYATS